MFQQDFGERETGGEEGEGAADVAVWVIRAVPARSNPVQFLVGMGMPLGDWNTFFQGELGAAAALAGLLFVAISVNQARILELGRTADRGLEALAILFLVMIVASLPLIPGQPLRWLGAEILALGLGALAATVSLQRLYMHTIEEAYRADSLRMVMLNRAAVVTIAVAGLVLLSRGDIDGLYVLPFGILLSFLAAGASAWVLLVEINR